MSKIQKINRALAVLILAGAAASPARAHFILTAPDSWLDEDQSALGGGAPQKGGPCGPGGYDDVQPVPMNGKVTTFKAGDTVHVTWNTTVPHDGYFRISLAENRADFKDPHLDDTTACSYDMSTVQVGPHDNVLMDGIKADATSQDVVLPNKPCDKCTLQVLQVMKDHGPPNCIYYHCADLKITGAGAASDAGVTDGGIMMMGSGGMTAGSGGMTAGTGGVAATGSGGAKASGSGGMVGGTAGTTMTPPATGSGGATSPMLSTGSGGTTTLPAVVDMPQAKKSSSGCAVAQPGADGTGRTFCFLFGLSVAVLSVRSRRRRRA